MAHTEAAVWVCKGHTAEQEHLVRLECVLFLLWTWVLAQDGTEILNVCACV